MKDIITRKMIQYKFSETDFSRGVSYYRAGRVAGFYMWENDDLLTATCTVKGTHTYPVHLRWDGQIIRSSCACPRAVETGACKHMVAALLTLVEKQESASLAKVSNTSGQRLIEFYQKQNNDTLAAEQSKKVRLVPAIRVRGSDSFPRFTFSVGRTQLYKIRDVREFVGHIAEEKTIQYGKNLTFCHRMDQFDDLSQQIIALVIDEFPDLRSLSWTHRQGGYYREHRYCAMDEIQPTGKAFERWFDLFREQCIANAEKKGHWMCFLDADPKVSISLNAFREMAHVEIESEPTVDWFFGGPDCLYAVCDESILRCSETFRQKLYPLFRVRSDIRLSKKDLPDFCSYVLPEVKELATVEDKAGLLTEFLPDACTACYYFDMQEDVLTAELRFRYGEKMVSASVPAGMTAGIKRDVKAEQEARVPLVQHMNFDAQSSRFYLVKEDEIFSFLTDTLPVFHNYGEVYISQQIQGMRVGRKTVQTGISVSGGIITMDLDTGEFPAEELEALYQSMLQKKKYHRLKDGRFLEINGSPYEAMAEAAHMLQLAPKDLQEGTVTMPAFRAPYLDQVLQDAEGLSVHRDKGFRRMLRAFKSVADSDHLLPEDLEPVLRPYQKYGFQWLKTLEENGFGGILADDMGLGKTAQAIAWLRTVPRDVVGAPSLVVCPTSLVLNWADECAKFAPDLKVKLMIGNSAERRKTIAGGADYDLWVTSYDLLKRDVELYQPLEFYGVILDEAQFIKNKSTLASKAVKQINCRQRFVLTGTPIENRLSELWNLFDFLMPGYLFSHKAFVEKLEKPIAKSKNPEAGRRLSLLVQPFLLRRLKKDVLKELPPKVEHVHNIQLSQEERKVYQAFALELKKTLQAGGQGKIEILAALTRLRQICCDPVLCLENYEGDSSKLDACIELCAGLVDNGHQVLVFSQFTSMLERIRERLDEAGIRSYTLQGSTSKEERAQLVKEFQAGGASVFLISLKAGGTGLNLTAADAVIHYDPWWNIAAQNQATDRAHRIGQKTSVHVYKLIAKGTIEEKIMELQARKAELMDVVTSETEESLHSLSAEELMELFD